MLGLIDGFRCKPEKKTLKLIHEASVVISVHVVKETSEKMQVATCEVVFFCLYIVVLSGML